MIREEKGSAMVMALGIILILMSLLVVFYNVAASDGIMAKRQAEKIKAYYVAESGLVKAQTQIFKNGTIDDTSGVYDVDFTDGNTATVTLPNDSDYAGYYVVKSVGQTSTGSKKTLAMVMTAPPQYGIFANQKMHIWQDGHWNTLVGKSLTQPNKTLLGDDAPLSAINVYWWYWEQYGKVILRKSETGSQTLASIPGVIRHCSNTFTVPGTRKRIYHVPSGQLADLEAKGYVEEESWPLDLFYPIHYYRKYSDLPSHSYLEQDADTVPEAETDYFSSGNAAITAIQYAAPILNIDELKTMYQNGVRSIGSGSNKMDLIYTTDFAGIDNVTNLHDTIIVVEGDVNWTWADTIGRSLPRLIGTELTWSNNYLLASGNITIEHSFWSDPTTAQDCLFMAGGSVNFKTLGNPLADWGYNGIAGGGDDNDERDWSILGQNDDNIDGASQLSMKIRGVAVAGDSINFICKWDNVHFSTMDAGEIVFRQDLDCLQKMTNNGLLGKLGFCQVVKYIEDYNK
ncbi:MAG: pilus assembly PilX N-terminal domain-containing protein [Chitinophagales bacterium]